MSEDRSSLERTLSLARMAQAGDASARGRFVQRYEVRLRHIVSLRMGKMLREFSEVDDIVQETFIHCLAHLDKVEVRSDGQLRNWMATIATNVICSQARQLTAGKRDVHREVQRARSPLDGTNAANLDWIATQTTPSELAMAREFGERLERALLQLEPRQREAFILLRLCGMSIDEAAAELGVTTSTVRAHQARGLARLSGILYANLEREQERG